MDVDWCASCGRHTRGKLYCSLECMRKDGGNLEDVDDDVSGATSDADSADESGDLAPDSSVDEQEVFQRVVAKARHGPAAGADEPGARIRPRRSSAPTAEQLARQRQRIRPQAPWVKAYDDGPDEDELDPLRFDIAMNKGTFDGTYHQVQAFKARKKAMETEQQRERKAIDDSRNFLKSYQKQRVWGAAGRGMPASSAASASPTSSASPAASRAANSAALLSQSIPVREEVEIDPSLFLRTYDYGMSKSKSRYQRDDSYLEELMRQPWFQSSQ